MTILIVRLSSNYDDAGLFALAMSVYGIFLPIAQYRMYIYQISDDKNENTTGEYCAFRMITCLISLALCAGYAALTCAPSTILTIVLFGVYKCAGQLIDVLHAADQLHDRLDYAGRSLCFQGIGSLACFVLMFAFTGNLNLTLVAMVIIVLLVGALYDYPRTAGLTQIKFGITAKKTFHLLSTCFLVVLGGIAFSASPQLPRQFLFSMFGESTLGIYASAAAPIAIIQMGACYIYYPFMTHLTKTYHAGDMKGFVRLVLYTTVAIAVLGIACLIALQWLAVPLLVLMYGETIAAYGYLITPLTIAAIITGYTWFVNDLLIALRYFKTVFVASIVQFVIALAVSVPFISAFEMNGVTFANIASCIAGLCLMGVMLIIKTRQLSKNV